jgi:transcriptional regulator with XRE-family HTH domain
MNGSLKDQRKALGITREALAHEVGCSVAMLGLLEAGYRPASSEVLARVEAALNDHTPAGNGRVEKEGAGAAHPGH